MTTKKILSIIGIMLGISFLCFAGVIVYFNLSFKLPDFCGTFIKKELLLVNNKQKLVYFTWGCGPDADPTNYVALLDINDDIDIESDQNILKWIYRDLADVDTTLVQSGNNIMITISQGSEIIDIKNEFSRYSIRYQYE